MITIKAIILSLVSTLLLATPVMATTQEVTDACGAQFEYTKTSDFTDNRVAIDFVNTDSAGNPDTVGINAQVANGYKLVSVLLDVDSDLQIGYFDYTSNFPGTFNPNPGEKIQGAKVTVTKDCTPVCNDPAATNYEELKEGQTVADNKLCNYPQPEQPPEATPSAPKAENPPTELPKTGGGFEFAVLAVGAIAIGVAGRVLFRKKED